jgi:hypothetical protein
MKRKRVTSHHFKARNSVIFLAFMLAGMLIPTLLVQDHFNYIKSVDASDKIAAYKVTRIAANEMMEKEARMTAQSDNKQLELALKAATASAKTVQLTKAEAKEMIATTFPKEYRDRFAKITMECENGRLNSTATNTNKDGSHDIGMSQINDKWHRDRVEKMFGMDFELAMKIPLLNYMYAAWLVEHDKNFHQWACDRLV